MIVSSSKKEIIRGFLRVASLEKLDLHNEITVDMSINQLIIVTAGCVITGIPTQEIKDSELHKNDSISLNDQIKRNAAISHHKQYGDKGLGGNDGAFLLENVSIKYSDNFTVNLPELVLFYDQIVAIAIGNPG